MLVAVPVTGAFAGSANADVGTMGAILVVLLACAQVVPEANARTVLRRCFIAWGNESTRHVDSFPVHDCLGRRRRCLSRSILEGPRRPKERRLGLRSSVGDCCSNLCHLPLFDSLLLLS